MKLEIPSTSSRKRRKRAMTLIRRLAKHRRLELESGLLVHATRQIADGDVSAARVTLERYEITTTALSKNDIASLQCVKDALTTKGAAGVWSAFAELAFGVVVKGLPELWKWIRAHTQIYFISTPDNDAHRARNDSGDADRRSCQIIASRA